MREALLRDHARRTALHKAGGTHTVCLAPAAIRGAEHRAMWAAQNRARLSPGHSARGSAKHDVQTAHTRVSAFSHVQARKHLLLLLVCGRHTEQGSAQRLRGGSAAAHARVHLAPGPATSVCLEANRAVLAVHTRARLVPAAIRGAAHSAKLARVRLAPTAPTIVCGKRAALRMLRTLVSAYPLPSKRERRFARRRPGTRICPLAHAICAGKRFALCKRHTHVSASPPRPCHGAEMRFALGGWNTPPLCRPCSPSPPSPTTPPLPRAETAARAGPTSAGPPGSGAPNGSGGMPA